jgi:hypothetical protein
MILKGKKKGADDNRKYFIRITFKNNASIEFGSTWSEFKIKEKYQVCLAMIKGMVVPFVSSNLIKDESKYEEYIY